MTDKAYSSAANRAYLRRLGVKAVIPVKDDQKENRRRRGRKAGRPPAFDSARYKERNTVERCFSKLRQVRAVATRYDKRARIYQGLADAASIRIWLRHPGPMIYQGALAVRLPRQPLAGCREPLRLRLPKVALRH